MWRALRDTQGWPIISSWIDEAGEGETEDMGELWARIHLEIQLSNGVLLYAEPGDFPLKGALIECGMALGIGKPVALVLPGVENLRLIGSWVNHPSVKRFDSMGDAQSWLLDGKQTDAAIPQSRPALIAGA